MAGKFSNLIYTNQIADNSITEVELSVALQQKVAKITVNEGNITTLLSKFANNGAGELLNAFVPHIALQGYAGEVNTEAEMLALTTNLNGTPIEAGDTVDRLDLNQTFYFLGGDLTVATNWKPILSAKDGVQSLRNASGTIVGQKGIVTLADVAFSGAANDLSFSHADYTATNAGDALIEVMGVAKQNASDIDGLETAMVGKIGLSEFYPYVVLTGTIDGTNPTFTSSIDLTGAKVQAMQGGQIINPSDYTIAGNDVTFYQEPHFEQQRPALMIMRPAA